MDAVGEGVHACDLGVFVVLAGRLCFGLGLFQELDLFAVRGELVVRADGFVFDLVAGPERFNELSPVFVFVNEIVESGVVIEVNAIKASAILAFNVFDGVFHGWFPPVL